MVDSPTKSRDPDRWAWVRAAMPKVAQLMVERRRDYGAAHVAECWRRGMAGEPGWFFAREGPVAIGTPWSEAQDVLLAAATAWQVTSTQAMLFLRKPAGAGKEAEHGAQ